jgi:hypothetical protein
MLLNNEMILNTILAGIPWPSTGEILKLILFFLLSIIFFIILREIIMWYWKINERLAETRITNDLLGRLLRKQDEFLKVLKTQSHDNTRDVSKNEISPLRDEKQTGEVQEE